MHDAHAPVLALRGTDTPSSEKSPSPAPSGRAAHISERGPARSWTPDRVSPYLLRARADGHASALPPPLDALAMVMHARELAVLGRQRLCPESRRKCPSACFSSREKESISRSTVNCGHKLGALPGDVFCIDKRNLGTAGFLDGRDSRASPRSQLDNDTLLVTADRACR
ncbi:hypothetical protein HPB50_010046 [Hyalomma asiaticum]|uniref:Uncharacterized protein n=1 Tax=Hyalomma asiaticum TaxID=266040 RepID=A0ACB7S005_HYAAI|nr:hypothetical protein HPB50_010046 [Hyalomma asiaticum]